MTVEEYMTAHHINGGLIVQDEAYDINFWNPEGYLDETEFDFPGICTYSEFVRELSEVFGEFCRENHLSKDTATEIRYSEAMPVEVRRVLIRSGMDFDDFIYLRTDAPKAAIEDWCKRYVKELENGENTFLDSLKAQYQVDVIALSEECIGDVLALSEEADETYDLFCYYKG